jgi:hypothetical protein
MMVSHCREGFFKIGVVIGCTVPFKTDHDHEFFGFLLATLRIATSMHTCPSTLLLCLALSLSLCESVAQDERVPSALY